MLSWPAASSPATPSGSGSCSARREALDWRILATGGLIVGDSTFCTPHPIPVVLVGEMHHRVVRAWPDLAPMVVSCSRCASEAGDPPTAQAELDDVGRVALEHRFPSTAVLSLRVGDPSNDRPRAAATGIACVGAVLAQSSTVRTGRLDRFGSLRRLLCPGTGLAGRDGRTADNARPCHPSLLSISSGRDLQMRVVLDPPKMQGLGKKRRCK